MESAHRELIDRFIEGFNRRDWDAVLELVDPEVEIDDPERTGRTWRGHGEYLAFTAEWLENFDVYTVEFEELEEGPDGTFVRATQTGRGTGSGLEFSMPIHYAVRVADGRVKYMRLATGRDDARRAVGLE
jgi:ketosteroid isomerase-like protein